MNRRRDASPDKKGLQKSVSMRIGEDRLLGQVTVGRVMIVDDEIVIASTLAMILRRNGYDAKYFTEPLDALKAAATEAPDVLISDVVMPHMSGIDLAIAIRNAHPSCKVLLFSGQAATANLLATARGHGHTFEVMAKPVPPLELLQKLRAVLA